MELRAPTPEDADACGRILHESFAAVAKAHGFVPDFPSREVAAGLIARLVDHPGMWGVLADDAGAVLGSMFVDRRAAFLGVGPVSVAVEAQGRGVGRAMMMAAIGERRGAPGMRLVQDSFNCTSLSLYTSLGFQVREPALVVAGAARDVPSTSVRAVEPEDVGACTAICERVLGFGRAADLHGALEDGRPLLVERGGRVTGYVTGLAHFAGAHGVAESDADLRALVVAALHGRDKPGSFLLPSRQGGLLRWCLGQGLRVVKPMTYMSLGDYRDPAGAWIPSVSL